MLICGIVALSVYKQETLLCKNERFYSFLLESLGVIRIRNSKNRQHNGQKKQGKRTNNDLQCTTQKTRDPATPILLNIRVKSGTSEGQAAPAPLVIP
jgi:hypothetical protein